MAEGNRAQKPKSKPVRKKLLAPKVKCGGMKKLRGGCECGCS